MYKMLKIVFYLMNFFLFKKYLKNSTKLPIQNKVNINQHLHLYNINGLRQNVC